MNAFRTRGGWRIQAFSVALFGLTLSAHAVVVTFPDPHLETIIRHAISKPAGDILDSDLLGLTSLQAYSAGIANISGIEYCVNLTELDLRSNQIIDVSPLAGLSNLTLLDRTHSVTMTAEVYTGQSEATRSLGGVVTDATTTEAVVGVQVEVRKQGASDALASTTTNSQGIFLFTGLPVGDVQLTLTKAGYQTQRVNATVVPGTLTPIMIAIGHTAFIFTEAPHSGQYQQGDSLSMRVAFIEEVGTPETQWTKNGVDIPGEVSNTFSKNPLTVDDTAAYRVRVTDDAKAVHVTPPAIITVTEGSPLPLATSLTAFLSLVGIALAGAMILRRVKKGPAFVRNE